jgi:acetolactate synthase-1/2/3 large subunit
VYLSPDLPDYKLWAEAMGCVGMRVDSPEEAESAIQKANEIDDRPVVIDFRTDSSERCSRWSPQGRATTTSSRTPRSERTSSNERQ